MFSFRVDDVVIEKSVFLAHGENTVIVQYELLGDLAGRPAELEVRALVAFRDYHGAAHANPDLRTDVAIADGVASIAPYDGLPLYISRTTPRASTRPAAGITTSSTSANASAGWIIAKICLSRCRCDSISRTRAGR